ncbi:MAG TPA: flagellar motor protein MotB [bacterium]|nr:flagellar motor protein MotB [bacterium]
MGRRRKEGEPSSGAPAWICTFSDMMSLLLCFFVLLFSICTLEQEKFYQAIGSIQGALGRIPGLFTISHIRAVSNNPQRAEPAQRIKTIEKAKEAIAEAARSKLVADQDSPEVRVEGVKEGIRFTLTGRILFYPGVALLTPEGKRQLDILAGILNEFPDLRIRVEGHTDDAPLPGNSPFQNHWRLAQARAFETMEYLTRQVTPPENRVQEERFSVMSCGSHRPRFPNDTEEHRALNRRVEIVLLQGRQSETVTGVLEGSGNPQIAPDEKDFLPRQPNGASGPGSSGILR